MDTKMLKKVGTAFKYGARVVQDGAAPLNLVDLSYGKSDAGTPTLLGWAYPNKDMYYEVSSLEERSDGWVMEANGSRYLFKPLDKQTGQALATNMKDA